MLSNHFLKLMLFCTCTFKWNFFIYRIYKNRIRQHKINFCSFEIKNKIFQNPFYKKVFTITFMLVPIC